MLNRKEYKVVVFWNDGEDEVPPLLFVTDPARTATPSVAFHQEPGMTDIPRFAKEASKAFFVGCPGVDTDGLLRVNIMQTSKGRLIVNEFESLEAMYASNDMQLTHAVESKLEAYWTNVIESVMNELLLTTL